MIEEYIEDHFEEIIKHESEIESRLVAADCTVSDLKKDNCNMIVGFQRAGEQVILIDSDYKKVFSELLT